ncbi:MAG: 4-(cytidine 5'-diphospho)-2-C-methyl-D-erythritol kinase [Kiritimatiellae bacterium]|nr:4-(cytidine 5'-diphospho)-2-C-methyl-D-erythritol kinase [Kiritimatiellia bacterium]
MCGQKLLVKAPAKINLFLDVLGRREDGYHEIESLLVPTSLCDALVLETTDGPIETRSDAPRVPESKDNLATRAAELLKARTGYPGGVIIHLQKEVPIGGGLGGGSSDAAAVLKGLNRLWGTGLDRTELVRLGAELGADVPGLVYGGAVCQAGRGEIVTPVPPADHTGERQWWVLLVNPGLCIWTRDIYSRYKAHLTSPRPKLSMAVSAWQKGAVELAARSLFNALQETVFIKYPLLRILARELEAAGSLGVLLSGTGATLYAFARDEQHAMQIDECVRGRTGCPLWSKVDCLPRQYSETMSECAQ